MRQLAATGVSGRFSRRSRRGSVICRWQGPSRGSCRSSFRRPEVRHVVVSDRRCQVHSVGVRRVGNCSRRSRRICAQAAGTRGTVPRLELDDAEVFFTRKVIVAPREVWPISPRRRAGGPCHHATDFRRAEARGQGRAPAENIASPTRTEAVRAYFSPVWERVTHRGVVQNVVVHEGCQIAPSPRSPPPSQGRALSGAPSRCKDKDGPQRLRCGQRRSGPFAHSGSKAALSSSRKASSCDISGAKGCVRAASSAFPAFPVRPHRLWSYGCLNSRDADKWQASQAKARFLRGQWSSSG
jgi:hypothetical protein